MCRAAERAVSSGSEIEMILMGAARTCTRRMSAPASASAIAIACPIPRVPPVTRAVCPSRENSCCTDAILLQYFAW